MIGSKGGGSVRRECRCGIRHITPCIWHAVCGLRFIDGFFQLCRVTNNLEWFGSLVRALLLFVLRVW